MANIYISQGREAGNLEMEGFDKASDIMLEELTGCAS